MKALTYHLLNQYVGKNYCSNVSSSITRGNLSCAQLRLLLPMRQGHNRLYRTILMPACFRT